MDIKKIESWLAKKNEPFSLLGGENFTNKEVVLAHVYVVAVEFKTFQALVDKGLILARRSGGAVNSPLFYSKAEIQRALATMRMNRYFVNDKILDYGRHQEK